MSVTEISFQETNYFSSLICDYIDNHDNLKAFYTSSAEIEAFRNIITAKEQAFSLESRKVLTNVLDCLLYTSPSPRD